MITASDVVLALSNSGETPELVFLLPHLKRLATPLITLTGNLGLDAGAQCHGRLGCDRAGRGLPAEPRPTASTTAMLAMGDALAVTLLEARGFTASGLRPLASGRDAGAAPVPAGRGHHAARR